MSRSEKINIRVHKWIVTLERWPASPAADDAMNGLMDLTEFEMMQLSDINLGRMASWSCALAA